MLRSLSAATMAALWLSLSLPSTDAKNKIQGLLNKNDIPDSGRDWISFANGVEFQPGADTDVRLENLRRHLGYSSTTTTNNGQAMQQPYVDGSETYYDEYAQAWRALGWYIDCSSCGGDDHNNNNDNANGLGSCVGAGEGGGGGNNNDNTAGCQRYLLWAAVRCLSFLACMIVSLQSVCGILKFVLLTFSFYLLSSSLDRQTTYHKSMLIWIMKDTVFMSTNTMTARVTNGVI